MLRTCVYFVHADRRWQFLIRAGAYRLEGDHLLTIHWTLVLMRCRYTGGERTAAVDGRTSVALVGRRSATRWVSVNTEQYTAPTAALSVISVASASRGRQHCPLTYSSTPTRDLILASSAARGSTRNQTWRNTPTFTPVCTAHSELISK